LSAEEDIRRNQEEPEKEREEQRDEERETGNCNKRAHKEDVKRGETLECIRELKPNERTRLRGWRETSEEPTEKRRRREEKRRKEIAEKRIIPVLQEREIEIGRSTWKT